MKPIKFEKNEDDPNDQSNLILDEEHEVTDMYFIQGGGVIGIGFYLMTQGLSKKQFKFGITCDNFNYYICDYYCCFNLKSEFIYMALTNVEAISLSKEFFQNEIFQKYPKIAQKIKANSEISYMRNIR